MHRLIVDRASMWGPHPGKLGEMEVRFDQLAEVAQDSYHAARRGHFKNRPGTRVKHLLRNQLLGMPFQSLRSIDDALAMAGASGRWRTIGGHLGLNKQQISARLSPIVLRRNQIAYEGDYRRLDKPQNPGRNAVSVTEAQDAIDFIRDFVGAIDASI